MNELFAPSRWISCASFFGYGLYCLFSPAAEREFERYRLPRLRRLTGFLEVAGAAGLAAGTFWAPLLPLSSAGLALLMVAAIGTRLRIGDPLAASLPAFVLCLANAFVFAKSR